MLARYAQQLDDEYSWVRTEAIRVLGRMEPQVLAKYAQYIIPRLGDDDQWVRRKAIEALGKLEPQVLARYAQQIIPRLDDEWHVRAEAIKVLGKLEPQVLARYAQQRYAQRNIARLDDEDRCVRSEAIKALGMMEPQVLAKYAQQIIARLGDYDLALVPHRHALQCRSASAASLRGRVWLVRWRQLVWGERLLWWWGSRAWAPGSSQAALLADQFGCMQRRGQKRARS